MLPSSNSNEKKKKKRNLNEKVTSRWTPNEHLEAADQAKVEYVMKESLNMIQNNSNKTTGKNKRFVLSVDYKNWRQLLTWLKFLWRLKSRILKRRWIWILVSSTGGGCVLSHSITKNIRGFLLVWINRTVIYLL